MHEPHLQKSMSSSLFDFAYPLNSTGGWEVLDVANKRLFTLSDGSQTKYVRQVPAALALADHHHSLRATLAADGGLFCASYSLARNPESSGAFSVQSCSKIVKQLPHFPGLVENYQRVVMSTDRVSMEYEIFGINRADDPYQPNAVHIYESKTDTWRMDSSARSFHNSFCGDRRWYPVSIFVQNQFYKLYRSTCRVAGIVSYNKVTGVVSIESPASSMERQFILCHHGGDSHVLTLRY